MLTKPTIRPPKGPFRVVGEGRSAVKMPRSSREVYIHILFIKTIQNIVLRLIVLRDGQTEDFNPTGLLDIPSQAFKTLKTV